MLPYFMAMLIAASDPSPADFTKLPETVLKDGLTTITVCIATDMVGLRKLAELSELIQAEPPADVKQQAKLIKESAESLLTAMIAEAKVGSSLIQALEDRFHYKDTDLLNTVQTTMTEAKADIEEAVGEIVSVDELDEKFGPKVESCDKALISWSQQVKKSLPLENEK